MLNMIRSMYSSVKSRVKLLNELSDEYECLLGVIQGECLSPFCVRCLLNDIVDVFFNNGLTCTAVNMSKIFLLLYADDIVLFADSKAELQTSLNALYDYCQKWKLVVNTNKTKIMAFQKRVSLSNNLKFYSNNLEIEIVNTFTYLDMVFSTGG